MWFKKFTQAKSISIIAVWPMLMASASYAQSLSEHSVEADPATMWSNIGYYLLLFLLAVALVVLIGKVLNIYDLTLQVRGKAGIPWNKVMGLFCMGFLIIGLYSTYWSYTVHGSMILPAAASSHGEQWDMLFYITVTITTVVFVVTQTLLFAFAFKYKGTETRKAYFYPHNNTLEKFWTLIPAVVLTALVLMGSFVWVEITSDPTDGRHMTNIDITGHQFAWEIRYPGKDGKLGTKNYKLISANNKLGVDVRDRYALDDLEADELVLPVNKPVRLNFTAQDVIHSFYMPWFRVQMNCVPGLPTNFRFVPTVTTEEMRRRLEDPKFEYKFYCAKICGASHFNMQKTVQVVSEEVYQVWLTQQRLYLNDRLRKEGQLALAPKSNDLIERPITLSN